MWVTREDPSLGLPLVGPLSHEAEPVAVVSEDAGRGRSRRHRVRRLRRRGPVGDGLARGPSGFTEPETDPLPGPSFSDAISVTAVGGAAVVLEVANGRLSVIGGGDSEIPEGAVLQQPGPSASAVLVGARDALLSVDLASGA